MNNWIPLPHTRTFCTWALKTCTTGVCVYNTVCHLYVKEVVYLPVITSPAFCFWIEPSWKPKPLPSQCVTRAVNLDRSGRCIWNNFYLVSLYMTRPSYMGFRLPSETGIATQSSHRVGAHSLTEGLTFAEEWPLCPAHLAAHGRSAHPLHHPSALNWTNLPHSSCVWRSEGCCWAGPAGWTWHGCSAGDEQGVRQGLATLRLLQSLAL